MLEVDFTNLHDVNDVPICHIIKWQMADKNVLYIICNITMQRIFTQFYILFCYSFHHTYVVTVNNL